MVGSPQRRILICLDERSSSDKLFKYAVENVYRAGDKIHILHVIAPCKRPAGMLGMADINLADMVGDDAEARCEVERHARGFIKERFESRLKELHIPFKTEIARCCCDCDSIGALLCKRAEELNAAMLVMSKHQRGKIKAFFIGSVSNYALHHCKQPVLVLSNQ